MNQLVKPRPKKTTRFTITPVQFMVLSYFVFTISGTILLSQLRGKRNVHIMNRELFQDDILRAFMVFTLALILVFSSAIILLEIENFALRDILFEVCSAFGTTGLSTGIVEEFSTAGKLVIIFLMFIGRIGILSLLLLFHNNSRLREEYHLIKEKVIIG